MHEQLLNQDRFPTDIFQKDIMTRILAATALAVWLTGSSHVLAEETPKPEPMAKAIEKVISAPLFEQAHWGILVADRASGEILYQHNPDRLFAPASTTKLFTVAAALEALGPDHHFETPVYARGTFSEKGELDGDLILVASGDPTLGGRTDKAGHVAFANSDHTYANGNSTAQLTKPDPLAGLNALAREISEAGIFYVRGDVLIDDRLFASEESTGSGPRRVTPIMVNDNLIDVTIIPGEEDQPATIDWRPRTAAYQVKSQVRTVSEDGPLNVRITSEDPHTLIVRGTIPVKQEPLVRVVEVDDPADFARALFIEALRRHFVLVEAKLETGNRRASLPDDFKSDRGKEVARFASPPFSENTRLILKVSHNLHASTLPLLLAAQKGRRTLDEGMRREGKMLARLGVEVGTISLGGGAGGSRADYISPRAAVSLLRHMAIRDDFEVYYEALPVLGVDGTLASAVSEESPARGNVHAKTGTFYWHNALNDRYLLLSKALAGYVTTEDGRDLVFACFVNNVHLKNADQRNEIGRVLGHLCEIFYGSKEK